MRISLPSGSRKKRYPFINKTIVQLYKERFFRGAADFLSRNYGWIIPVLGIITIFTETIEHLHHQNDGHFYYVIEVVFTILLLTTAGFLTRMLLVSLEERSQAIDILHLKHELGMQLSSSLDLCDVANRLVQQVSLILPEYQVRLYLHDKSKNWVVSAPKLVSDQFAESASGCAESMDPYICRHCMASNSSRLRPFRSCFQPVCFQEGQLTTGYCLPLAYDAKPVGLLHVTNAMQKDLTEKQMKLLQSASAEMSISLSVAIQKKNREEEMLTQKIRSMQLDIARDLHDTIGQNVSYLRMKLDHLASSNLQSKTDLLSEIRHMSSVADDSYDLIRGMLAVLQSGNSADMLHLFSRYANQVADRSEFAIDFHISGTQREVSPNLLRQLFYILREAISNIEKHAHATQVRVEMNWSDHSLELVLSDNGVGFDPERIQTNEHYGVKFMRERAESLQGSFSIHSTIGAGTSVIIHAPCQ